MLDDAIKSQLRAYFERLVTPIELVATLGDDEKSRETLALLEDLVPLSDKITLRADGDAPRSPSFGIARRGEAPRVNFAGLPMGHEFNSLILALLHVGGYAAKESADAIAQAKALQGEFVFETFFSLTCQNCPDVVQALNLLAALNPGVKHTAIEGGLFQEEVERRKIMAVPTIFLNGVEFGQGRMSFEQILARLDVGAAAKAAEKLRAKPPFDVLVIGGGPAGAAAAIYAARKGIVTGVLAERFGGQVLDTMAIENFISVPTTDGPKMAAALEQHVKDYDVDVMNLQKAVELIPGPDGGLTRVRLENGAVLSAKTVILSTGARWRQMNAPGEDEYRNKGVAYCPHCDGPLFKGKKVAVIGGGNSGVEAAIDLAGVVAHVTLIEFDGQLRADAVLQTKLRSLKNVDVLVSALTTEVHGNGEKVVALSYKNRKDNSVHRLELDGIFVQIGLVPNTEWLKGTLSLSPRGEIEVDARGATSVPGVFAAGDCTTTPYKQIIIAMGEGAKASLSAFDHLIRMAPEEAEAA